MTTDPSPAATAPIPSPLQAHIDEIYEYLNDSKADVRRMAVELLAGLSVDQPDALVILNSDPAKYVSRLFSKLSDQPVIAALAWDALTNFASDKEVALYLLDKHLERILACVRSRELVFSEAATKLLSNLTKYADTRPALATPLLADLIHIYLAGIRHNPNCDYAFLASCFADLTNIRECRIFFLEDLSRLNSILQDLHSKSVIRRGGVASIIRNCLFETDYHAAILEKEIEDDFIITTLAGRLLDSRSKLDGEERDKLPVELQLLDKLEAESDIAVRSIVVECLIILGTTREGRDTIRAKEIYPILREWHILEENYDMKELIEKLVELLIRDEA
ncbi:hypothetical protein PSACC_02854 [Paramicrosporidium saccamoebae]|uniref:Protein HGH1 homolog n=1 Tax=Paramicrosporidium saccamoebae TaxID=1246581 RepID=A0A2H9THZ4_9FUNG|nr:hypothetical protein PSACC_02854 [Paramicrosporidium saccamoebae]